MVIFSYNPTRNSLYERMCFSLWFATCSQWGSKLLTLWLVCNVSACHSLFSRLEWYSSGARHITVSWLVDCDLCTANGGGGGGMVGTTVLQITTKQRSKALWRLFVQAMSIGSCVSYPISLLNLCYAVSWPFNEANGFPICIFVRIRSASSHLRRTLCVSNGDEHVQKSGSDIWLTKVGTCKENLVSIQIVWLHSSNF